MYNEIKMYTRHTMYTKDKTMSIKVMQCTLDITCKIDIQCTLEKNNVNKGHTMYTSTPRPENVGHTVYIIDKLCVLRTCDVHQRQ